MRENHEIAFELRKERTFELLLLLPLYTRGCFLVMEKLGNERGSRKRARVRGELATGLITLNIAFAERERKMDGCLMREANLLRNSVRRCFYF